MAGYGLKSFLIAQSLNQIEKAYGPNNAILDNCHVRVSFATNDERTAKRVSDALGTATEMRALRNYAGHRLSPWLGHLMVSRQETARPLLTPGEVMQLLPGDELVLVSGVPPIRAKKARYFEDPRLTERVLAPLDVRKQNGTPPPDDWSQLPARAVENDAKRGRTNGCETRDWATVRGFRQGENPARWRGHLDKLLPTRSKVRKAKHHAALPYDELSAFMTKLGAQDGVAARALEFLILTAARTGEVIGAQSEEIKD
jgi:type IV secretion system protein VirD4